MNKYITLGEWDKKRDDKRWSDLRKRHRDIMEDAAFERGDCDTTKEHYEAYGYSHRSLTPDE